MKKLFSVLLSCVMLISLLPCMASAEISFPDVPTEHWAYSYIMQLVADGTINGYEDGTFAPDKLVSRAEFVKMIGKGNEKETVYNDVAKEHWAYEYVTTSGITPDASGNFRPSDDATRQTVVDLLWARNGSISDVWAPNVITEQTTTKASVSWAYSYGLMQGDDGISLRLADGIRRSEAAALIVRARSLSSATKKDFADVVNSTILQNVYNSLAPFEGEFAPDKAVTNGEMARAALKIGCEESVPTYAGLSVKVPFEHKYAKDLYILGQYCIGNDKITAAFADKPASFKDTVAFLTYNFARKANTPIDISSLSPELSGKVEANINIFLTFAKNYGIFNFSDSDLDAQVTQKDFVALLLLFDNAIGAESATTTSLRPAAGDFIQIDTSLNLSNAPYNTNYKMMLESIPYEIYKVPFDSATTPKHAYDFARDYDMIFINMLNEFKSLVKAKSGADVTFTYYPSLVCSNDSGYVLRVKCAIDNLSAAKTLSEIFPSVTEGLDASLAKGDSCYLELSSQTPVTSMILDANTVLVTKIFQ